MDEFETDDGYDAAPTQSSIAAPLLRALFFAAIAFGIYALIFTDIGGDDIAMDEPTAPEVTTPLPTATNTPPPLTVLPTETPTAGAPASPDPLAPASPDPDASPGAGEVGAGVTVQVLAGADTTRAQVDDAISVLRDLGYDVTDAGIARNPYAETTIFATAGEEANAQALAAADERFTTVGENPGNLTDQIQVHVVVGEDWPT